MPPPSDSWGVTRGWDVNIDGWVSVYLRTVLSWLRVDCASVGSDGKLMPSD